MNKKKLILFDYDGVLVDSMSFNLEVVSSVLKKMGFDDFPTVKFCREAECISFEAWAREIGIPESRMAEYVSAIHRGVIVGANSLVVFDGICEVLKSLSSENDLGVITANASEATDRFLIHHGIRDYFSFIVGCETIGSKSEKITDIIDRNGYPVSDVYFVGDAGTDIQQGKLSGVNTIAVTWGFQGRSRLEKEKPDFIVDNMKDLSHILME